MNPRLLLETAIARGKGPLLAILGVIVLVFAGATWSIVQAQRDQGIVKEQLATARLKSDGQPGRLLTTSASERLARFHAVLGTRANLDQHMRKIYETARKRNLQLEVGNYRLVTDTPGGFQRYQIQLPIDGPFSGIQGFSQQVLLELPFAALEGMTFQRESIDAPVVEAELRFVLFLASDQPTAQRVAAPQARAR